MSLMFTIVFFLLNGAFAFYYFSLKQEFINHLDHRMKFGMKLIYDHPSDLHQKLSALLLEQLDVKAEIIQKGEVVGGDGFYRIYDYHGEFYGIGNYPQAFDHDLAPHPFGPPPLPREFHHDHLPPPLITSPHVPPVMLHSATQEPFTIFFGIWIITLSLISALFVVIIRKLLPLKRLKEAIVSLRNGDGAIAIDKGSEDEIGQVAYEFQKTVETLTHVKEARTLFLRNVLHELNTPIMKGKLLSDMVDNNQTQESLKRVFGRLEVVLGELVMIERFSSQTVALSYKNYRVVDLLDHAQDLLLLDSPTFELITPSHDQWIDADFDLFATALKNLLDNALRYTQDNVKIIITDHNISIINKAPPLSATALQFDRPFNRSFESSSHGLGLGLYIANEIIARHGYEMHYSYYDGNVIFTIKL